MLLDNVRVPKTHLVPGYKGYDHPTADGAIFQIIQAAVDTGIAKAAIDETIGFVRTKARAWIDSGPSGPRKTPIRSRRSAISRFKLHAAEALLEKAGRAIDAAVEAPTQRASPRRRSPSPEAKVLSTEIAIEATNRLFELAGTRSTLAEQISIGTGATRAPIPCMIPSAGNTPSSAIIS